MTNPSRSKVLFQQAICEPIIFTQIKLKTLFDIQTKLTSEMIYSFGRDPYLPKGLYNIKKRLFDKCTNRMSSYMIYKLVPNRPKPAADSQKRTYISSSLFKKTYGLNNRFSTSGSHMANG